MNSIKKRFPNSFFSRGNAFTLVEFVVVLSIVVVLSSLTIICLGNVREQARQVSCMNNIRQVALAVSNSESRYGKYPSLKMPESEASLWFSLASDLGISIDLESYDPVYASATLPTFIPEPLLCPGDVGSGANYRFNVGATLSWQPSLDHIVPGAGNGVVVYGNKPVTSAAISDGLSQTALVCERLAGTGYEQPMRSIAVGPYLQNICSPTNEDFVVEYLEQNFSRLEKTHDGGERWTVGMWRTIGYNHVLRPQSDYAGTFNRGSGWWCNFGCVPPTAVHTAGVMMATCDGATRAVAGSVDIDVWQALGTRAAED